MKTKSFIGVLLLAGCSVTPPRSMLPDLGAPDLSTAMEPPADLSGFKGTPVDFSVPPLVPPTLTGISPAAAATSGGSLLTLKGTGFLPGVTVSIDNIAAGNVVLNSSTQITVSVPPCAGCIGPVPVEVVNANGGTVVNTGKTPPFSYTPSKLAFSNPIYYATSTTPTGIAIADINGDGKPDIVLNAQNSNQINLFTNLGDGLFGIATVFATSAAPFNNLVLVDLNGDKKPDVLTPCFNSNVVNYLTNTGNGGFNALINPGTSTGSGPAAVAVADLNGDGNLDFVVAEQNANDLATYINGGSQSWTRSFTVGTSSQPVFVALADFNEDGHLDATTANFGNSNINVLIGSATGSFATPSALLTGVQPEFLAVGDFNGDKHQDIVAASTTGNTLSLFLGTGNGSFQTVMTIPTAPSPRQVVAADVNLDGVLDLIVTNNFNVSSQATLSVFLGRGDGTFEIRQDFPTDQTPYGVAVADLNGDGLPDLAISHNGANAMSVLLNASQ